MEQKQIAIVGAGTGGLLACKYCLSKGFNPTVFDFESGIGGVWTKTIKTTRLQLPKATYQFSDFPWPASVTDDFPTQQETLEYIRSYATHFNLMPHIKFHSRVKGISYDGPSSDTWSLWNGTGEAFPPEGKWNLTVENTKTATTQIYKADFVILCVGRFKDTPNIPKFPDGKGPEIFHGKAIHSMEYAAMDHDAAAEFVKGKKVTVVGFGKTGLDIAREISAINGPEHPCTIVYRKDHWKLGTWFPWGIALVNFMFCRITMLSVHKPGESLLLSLLATLLFPIRWGIWTLLETHAKMTLPLAKYNMVPKHGLSNDFSSGLLLYMPNPELFFDAVEKGSIKLVKSPSFTFYEKGIAAGNGQEIEADVVIYATGFDGVEKLKSVFESPKFGHYIAGSPRVPLYRETIPTRIPQVAVIGFSDGLSSLYTSEMRCRWVAALLEGAVKLPSIKEMQKDITRWDEYMKQSSGEYHTRSFFGGLEIWYNDLLCNDMGINPMRKKGLLANLFEPYESRDYAEI
ncbi:dimethylaniline monooxygenase, N-oxide-forming [Artemisia annua]|uniref:Flavin-containing monooxygenase n=1 Tax=Artemisia annua TaxID=35608 RepID=A0A2U1QCC9_ARTAN|nr:dimethylaniline monooxygenase, N-oxide-forming [Artemisia annua]